MLNIKSIMKIALFSAAALVLLRATTAFVSRHVRPESHEQLEHQSEEYQELVKTLASSNDFVEITAEEPIHIQQPKIAFKASADDESVASNPTTTTSTSSKPPQFSVGTRGKQWAMVYHAYNTEGSCRTRATVHKDMLAIASKGFSSIRLHNHDCSILPKLASSPVLTSRKIRIILGIHVDEEGLEAATPNVDEIISWGSLRFSQTSGADSIDPSKLADNWDMVEMVVVGEESIFNGHASASEVGSFISRTRDRLRQAGYTGPVTTTEPIHVLYESSEELCPHLDILASNIHPFFHPDIPAAGAGAFVEDTLDLLETAVCPPVHGHRMPAVNLETGWPWRGRPNGMAVPGKKEQMAAIEGILSRVGGKSVVLGFGDDAWMDEGEFGVEGSWGCDEMFRSRGGSS